MQVRRGACRYWPFQGVRIDNRITWISTIQETVTFGEVIDLCWTLPWSRGPNWETHRVCHFLNKIAIKYVPWSTNRLWVWYVICCDNHSLWISVNCGIQDYRWILLVPLGDTFSVPLEFLSPIFGWDFYYFHWILKVLSFSLIYELLGSDHWFCCD